MAKKILVIANETAASDELQTAVSGPVGSTEALVVAPAFGGEAAAAARVRLRVCMGRLAARGIRALGTIGDGDPLHVTLEALRFYPADEVVVSTHDDQRSRWVAKHLVERIAEHYDGPILHVVIAGERALLAA